MVNVHREAKTILLIDDEKALLFAVSEMVKKAGYKVLTASDGAEGLAVAQTHRPDLIVSDVTMPSPNGFELRQLLSQNPQTSAIPFIFLTSHGSPSDKERGFESGADDYITKPFNRVELLARIKAVLRRVALERKVGRAEAFDSMNELRQRVLSNVSQELRTPISSILQGLELSLMDRFSQEPAKQKRFIQAALNKAYLLERMVDDLITLTQIDQGIINDMREVLNLKFDFYPIVESFRTQWQKDKLNLMVKVEPGVVIYAPQSRFKHAVAHLLDNACKFSPRKGRIKIDLSRNGQGGCILTISDQGPGIPHQLREKVFERFFQIHQPDSLINAGLGVGLTIARSFARGLGGDVVILDSRKGCQVQMTIPST